MFGSKIKPIISVSFFLDYFSNYVSVLIQSWACFEFVCAYFGLIDSSAIIPGNNLKFFQYHPEILALRFIFVALVFLFFTSIFMTESYEIVKTITVYCAVFWSFYFLFLVWDVMNFRFYYESIGKLEVSYAIDFSDQQTKMFLVLLSSLYIQTSLMNMKSEIDNPNLRRMIKSSKIAYVYIFLFALIFGIYFYVCLGNFYTSDIFIVRKSFVGKANEALYVFFIYLMCA